MGQVDQSEKLKILNFPPKNFKFNKRSYFLKCSLFELFWKFKKVDVEIKWAAFKFYFFKLKFAVY